MIEGDETINGAASLDTCFFNLPELLFYVCFHPDLDLGLYNISSPNVPVLFFFSLKINECKYSAFLIKKENVN